MPDVSLSAGHDAANTTMVIVVGAGAAGLAAAYQLRRAGIDVIVLEARERIGGRVWTAYDMAAHPVELGAEFIHGASVSTWDLVKSFGLRTGGNFKDKHIYAALNGVIDKFDSLIEDDWEDDIWELAEDWLAAHEGDISLRDLLDEANLLTDHDSELARLINNTYAADYGADLGQLGAAGLLEASYAGDDSEAGDWRIREGYTRLMQRLAKGVDVRLRMPVAKITYGAGGVRIQTQTGDVYRAVYAIVTLPLGVLKAGDVQFEPPLPDDKQGAIASIGVGQVNKVILKFKKAFWRSKMSLLYTALDSQLWWRPGWGREDEAPILTAFAGGADGAKHSAMSEEVVVANSVKNLSQLYGKDLSSLLDWGRFINWGADPFARGGYSFNAVGSTGQRAILAVPLEDQLFFAGEATHTIRPQTVHGALETGFKVAAKITERMQQDRDASETRL